MFRWFVSSIILHHAQYIEWFSNHLSSPWATGLYVWMVLPASAIKKGKKKDKKRDGCFTCGSEEHWANKCPNKYQEARTGLQVCQCHSKQQWWGIWVWQCVYRTFSLSVHRLVGWHWGQYSCVCWCVFVFWQHINTKSTGMLSLILVELHKMFRWFVSSIILHHAQYIEWFSNHSSSPWATGLSDDKLMTNPARSTIIGITYFEWEKLVKV